MIAATLISLGLVLALFRWTKRRLALRRARGMAVAAAPPSREPNDPPAL